MEARAGHENAVLRLLYTSRPVGQLQSRDTGQTGIARSLGSKCFTGAEETGRLDGQADEAIMT